MAKGKIKIIMAESIGFCFGVERAYNMSLGLLGEGSCQMLGHLVHNEKVVDELRSKGLQFISDVDEAKDGTVIIRAHGVGDETMERLRARGSKIVDATCPLVRRTQDFARSLEKKGKRVVIIGEKGHAEVKAISGSIGERAVIVEKKGDLDDIPKGVPLGIVIQTTKDRKVVDEMISAVKRRFHDIEICNTLCHAVLKRQEEVKVLAGNVDILLVIGSKTSSNTQTLLKVAQREVKAYGVEGPDDLRKDWFDGVDLVGMTSGTSTPVWLVEKVKDKIGSITS